MQSRLQAVVNRTLITGAGEAPDGMILVRGGRIEYAGPRAAVPSEAALVDAGGRYISPGFIDRPVHGGGGSDFMDATGGDVDLVFRFHASRGTAALRPPTCAAPPDEILAALDAVHRCRGAGERFGPAPGAHIEGPCLALSKKGRHPAGHVRNPDENEWRAILERGPIASLTLAPELPGARPLIEAPRRNGANAGAGHSEALFHEMQEAADRGVNHVTHLYCAMTSAMSNRRRMTPRPRAAGIPEAVCLDGRLSSELICDGRHLSREMLLIALRNKGCGKLAIVTDALRGAGMPDGEYAFGPRHGLTAVARNGEARVPDGAALASGVLAMNERVRVFRDLAGCPLWQAVRMASLTPAGILGLSGETGSLDRGKRADLLLLDGNLGVAATYVGGVRVC